MLAVRGDEVLLIDRGRVPSEVTVLLLTMTPLICGGFGVVSAISTAAGAMAGRSVVIGAALLAVGVLAFGAMIRASGALRRVRRTPLSVYAPVAVFDRHRGVYRDSAGEVVALLSDVVFERRSSLLTSRLVAVTPSATRILLRGNAFTGGIGTLDRVLTGVVHGI